MASKLNPASKDTRKQDAYEQQAGVDYKELHFPYNREPKIYEWTQVWTRNEEKEDNLGVRQKWGEKGFNGTKSYDYSGKSPWVLTDNTWKNFNSCFQKQEMASWRLSLTETMLGDTKYCS